MIKFFTLIFALFAFTTVAYAQCPSSTFVNNNENRLFLVFDTVAERDAFFAAAGGNVTMTVTPGGSGTLFETSNDFRLRIDITGLTAGPYTGTITSPAGLACTYVDGVLQVALPISLTSFTAKKMEHSILLNWATERESDNDYFVVERSVDGRDFKQLTDVSGNGNSSGSAYSFEDKKPESATNYYRLRQVDFDGTESLSKIVTMDFASTNVVAQSDLNLYPTLVRETINLDLTNFQDDENVAVEIINGTGQVVLSRSINNSDIITLSTGELNLTNGMYFVRCQLTHEIVQGKFLVAN